MKKVQLFSFAVVLVVVAAIAIVHYRTNPIDDLLKEAGDREHRVTEARMTGGFPYKPVAPVTRGTDTQREDAVRALLAGKDGGPRAKGLSLLMSREWSGAANALDDALRIDTQREDRSVALAITRDAELLADLAAAHHALARATDDPREYAIAAEAAERAWRLAKTPEIAWNRALAIESLHLQTAARAAWRDYLAIDRDSPWAAEVQERMERLRKPSAAEQWQNELPRLRRAAVAGDEREIDRIVRAFPQSARHEGEQLFLAEWARQADSSAGAGQLALCRGIGRVLSRTTGESLLHDTVAAIDAATPRRRAAIVDAVLTYAAAVDARRSGNTAAARTLFLTAGRELAAAGVPLAQKARLYANDVDRSANAVDVVGALDAWLAERSLDERRYPALMAQVRWARGVWNLRAGRPQAAIDDDEAARALFHRLGESDSVASINLMLSEPYEFAGDVDKATRLRFAVMAHLAASGNEQSHVLDVFRLSAMTALRDGTPMVARLYLDRHLAATDTPSLYDTRFRLLLWRSAVHRALGEQAEAARDLRDARAVAAKIPDRNLRETALRDADVVRDRLRYAAGPAERQQILDDAVAFARARGLTFRLSRLYLEQGLEHFRAGRLDAAEVSFYEALERLEEQRRTIVDEELRGSIVDTRHAVHDALVTLLCRQSAYGRAFDVVERSRARSLFDRVSQRPAPAGELASISAISASLPDDTAIVEMAQVGSSLAVWIVSARGVRFVATPIERDELQRRVDRFRLALHASDETAARAAARALHDAAIAPWYRHARAFERLVFVPQDELSGVPFAALLDRSSGKFLVESHVVTIAPSANVFATCALRDRERATRGGPTLVVAPAASGSAGGGALLPASREEASEVARQYRAVDVLEGFLATRSEFVARAPRARYIHFAGHATASRGGAQMIFAPDAGGTATTLRTDEIRSLRLDTTRAVVLAACVSGSERAGSNQGTSSLARAFLAAGVPMVVGTLRDVDDEVAARLSRRLHVHLARGHDPAAALRMAQLQMLGSQHPGSARMRSWAAFAAFGGTNK